MKRTSILSPFIVFQSVLCWLSLAAVAQPLTSRSATASAYIDRGNVWISNGEYERAIADYDLAIASDPSYAGAYYNRATARHHLHHFLIHGRQYGVAYLGGTTIRDDPRRIKLSDLIGCCGCRKTWGRSLMLKWASMRRYAKWNT
jgi:tetratricopeptide (TPR) repeat protein